MPSTRSSCCGKPRSGRLGADTAAQSSSPGSLPSPTPRGKALPPPKMNSSSTSTMSSPPSPPATFPITPNAASSSAPFTSSNNNSNSTNNTSNNNNHNNSISSNISNGNSKLGYTAKNNIASDINTSSNKVKNDNNDSKSSSSETLHSPKSSTSALSSGRRHERGWIIFGVVQRTRLMGKALRFLDLEVESVLPPRPDVGLSTDVPDDAADLRACLGQVSRGDVVKLCLRRGDFEDPEEFPSHRSALKVKDGVYVSVIGVDSDAPDVVNASSIGVNKNGEANRSIENKPGASENPSCVDAKKSDSGHVSGSGSTSSGSHSEDARRSDTGSDTQEEAAPVPESEFAKPRGPLSTSSSASGADSKSISSRSIGGSLASEVPRLRVCHWHLLKRDPGEGSAIRKWKRPRWEVESVAEPAQVDVLCRNWIYSGQCAQHLLQPQPSDTPASGETGSDNEESANALNGINSAGGFDTSSNTPRRRYACPFRHFVRDKEEEERVNRLRRNHMRMMAQGAAELSIYNDGHSIMEIRERSKRSALFARWLLETFGIANLAAGGGVLDIAGGKGQNCFQLVEQSACSSLRTTVIDPVARRTLVPKRHRRRIVKLQCKMPTFRHVCFDEDFVKNDDGLKVVSEASCLIGMHPDQATGSIVKMAIKFKKPFAVVPCCVFAQNFTERKTPSGKRVETLNEFTEWLLAHHPNMKVDFLPFSGRNKVLYMLPHHFASPKAHTNDDTNSTNTNNNE